ncbi:hypothetical protein [Streptomyces alanosinicus]|uniref:Uncharacterized protein n=1 Tax=Streptomyces alanosinicus TaxID=68171 RepID=A0A919D4V8_9ACTN|nr:hypothetical protein [Streptomyces alanosinicus]GHE10539.1 hypothetical protein GCM10010339_67010 [Streptomyces alanosinicus]
MTSELELLPHIGAGPFRLGMSVEAARGVLREWELFRTVASDVAPGQIVLTHDGPRLDLVLGFTCGALSGVELFRFEDEEADVRVLLEGLDVFRTPSEDLCRQLAKRGHTVEENDLGFDALPELNMILASRNGPDGSTADEGDGGGEDVSRYYDYVLLADWI